ncbi:hypothetical protein CP061683_0506C, partial [Chlamydia psittaci 06-1683]
SVIFPTSVLRKSVASSFVKIYVSIPFYCVDGAMATQNTQEDWKTTPG